MIAITYQNEFLRGFVCNIRFEIARCLKFIVYYTYLRYIDRYIIIGRDSSKKNIVAPLHPLLSQASSPMMLSQASSPINPIITFTESIKSLLQCIEQMLKIVDLLSCPARG